MLEITLNAIVVIRVARPEVFLPKNLGFAPVAAQYLA
jgi:hypothetical protein